ncbi:MAG: hypothetical protein IH789_05005 [Acidobacteria bacterium]|nr:hypothetical protein [Acidobacteriota bacterium]
MLPLCRYFGKLDHAIHGVDNNQRAVFFVLSTELPRRPTDDVLRMEREWDWPLSHREGLPDLTDGEAEFFRAGKAGGWRKVLTEAQVAQMIEAHRKVMIEHGYLTESGKPRS